ncbi:MAG TPA: hypothetical protein ENN34_01595 [Deltaproteobacteria bacterium]|nr:hypothetical protein [Deltaproteobacteria bacterium]
MHIDWFILFAQIVNFLILVFLLKHFLFGRIIQAMDRREEEIKSRWDESERMRHEAQQTAHECDLRSQSLSDQAQEMLNKARKAAEEEKELLISKARNEVDQAQHRWYQTLLMERKTFLESLRRRSGLYVYETVRKVLTDLADSELEDRIVQSFLNRISSLDDDTLRPFHQTRKAKGVTIVIRSAFTLSPEHKDRIGKTVQEHMKVSFPIRYEVSPQIISGIELMLGGHKLSWSIDDYLEDLEEKFSQTLKEELPSPPLS